MLYDTAAGSAMAPYALFHCEWCGKNAKDLSGLSRHKNKCEAKPAGSDIPNRYRGIRAGIPQQRQQRPARNSYQASADTGTTDISGLGDVPLESDDVAEDTTFLERWFFEQRPENDTTDTTILLQYGTEPNVEAQQDPDDSLDTVENDLCDKGMGPNNAQQHTVVLEDFQHIDSTEYSSVAPSTAASAGSASSTDTTGFSKSRQSSIASQMEGPRESFNEVHGTKVGHGRQM